MSKEKELLKYAWPAVADYEKDVGFEVNDVFKTAWVMARTQLSYDSSYAQAMQDLKREPPMTGREMYQRGYAAAERDLKREPLSDEEINAINLPEKQCTLRELVRLIEKEHGIGIDDENHDA